MADESSASNPLDQLRLTLMQEVLPVGLAMVERAREGGPARVAEVFTAGAGDPLGELRQEGEPAARSLRNQLDQVSPGLGYPVMPVKVSVQDPDTAEMERQELNAMLERIAGRLETLRALLPSTRQA